jgi:hypothetical protein
MPLFGGRFARLVLLRLLARGSHSSQPCGLLVRSKDGGGLSTFGDMGVYTRNRLVHLQHGAMHLWAEQSTDCTVLSREV